MRYPTLKCPATMAAAALAVLVSAGCGPTSQSVSVDGFPPMLQPPELVQTWPSYGATLESPPLVVTVELAKPVSEKSELAVYRGDTRVDKRDDSIMIGSDKKLQVTVKTSYGEGLYRVEYKIVWREGGSNDGRFYFRVKRTTR